MKLKIFSVILCGVTGLALVGKPLNVCDFGAVGDGVTDDTAAIQKALNCQRDDRDPETIYVNDYGRIGGWGVYDGPHREIFFPAGEYKISRTLVGGKGVSLRGEEGTVIFTENDEIPIFYFEHFFRGVFRNLTFRGGRNHLYYSSDNQDTTSFVVENCRFEDSSGYAVTYGNYALKGKAANGSDWDRLIAVGPFTVTWDEEGMPTLSPSKWDYDNPNSTKFVLCDSEFIQCAGATDVSGDGHCVSNCLFVSDKVQELSPFVGSMSGCIYNTKIVAAIPEDFQGAFVEKYGAVINVEACSSTQYGAPLYKYDKAFRKDLSWSFPETILIENCVVDAAPSSVNAIAWFPKSRPVQFTMRNTHERTGSWVDAMHFDILPLNDEELMEDSFAASNVPQVPLAYSHAYCFSDNGVEINSELPGRLRQFVESDIPGTVRDAFPLPGRLAAAADQKDCKVFDAADFGIDLKPADTDYENLQKLFTQAAEAENPLILLPGRRFDLPGALTLPARAVIRAEGRAFFHANDENSSIFQAKGDDLALELLDLTIDGGTDSIYIAGAGTVRIDNCIFYDNKTAVKTEKTSESPLLVDLYAVTFYSPRVVENHGAEVRITDSWISIQCTLKEGPALRNCDDGTLVMFNICGVPVVFSDWPQFRPNWPNGFHLYWVENHGTYRSMFFRYGGEFGGIPVLDNYGAGRALIEGQNAHFYHGKSDKAFMRNESADAMVAVGTISSFWNTIPAETRAFCLGTAPGELYVANFPEPNGLILQEPDGSRSDMLNWVR